MRQVVFYKTASGECPVRKFLDSLPGKDAQKAVWVLSLLEELDALPANYFKKLQGSVHSDARHEEESSENAAQGN